MSSNDLDQAADSCRRLIESRGGAKQAAKELGISRGHIWAICAGKRRASNAIRRKLLLPDMKEIGGRGKVDPDAAEQVRILVRNMKDPARICREYISAIGQRSAGRLLGFSGSHLSRVASGIKKPGPRLMKALGLK